MPIKKPKSQPLPSPFRDLEKSGDESQRFRAIRMQREMAAMDGVSWNAPRPGLWQRIREQPRHRFVAAILATAMGMGIVGALVLASDTGYVPEERLIYFNSWGAGRTAEDAVADQKEAMDRLRTEVERNRAAVAAAEARATALERERAAARQATS